MVAEIIQYMDKAEIAYECKRITKFARQNTLKMLGITGVNSKVAVRWLLKDLTNGHTYRIRWGKGDACWLKSIRKYHNLYSKDLPLVITGQGCYQKGYEPRI